MSNYFPHVVLRLVREGNANPGGRPRPQKRSLNNLNNRAGHGQTLQNSTSGIVSDWQQQLSQRKQAKQPGLPKAVPFILQVDPNSFQPEQLRSFGIEVIAELENGFILGASSDLKLTDLQKKITQFINAEYGGNKAAEIWEIIARIRKPEYILSPQLLEQWQQIQDDQVYIVDVGIACIGIQSQLSNYPKRKENQSNESFAKATNSWLEKRDQTFEEWDDLKSEREDALVRFVQGYCGEIMSSFIDGKTFTELPDSFSCRISITGKGLKDLVLNFPYVFDVAEPDDIHETLTPQPSQQTKQCTVRLQPPKPDAPRVCIIDSGIQEEHPLLKAAVETASSRSWVPNETGITADLVSNGGHGTRVAGAVLYPGSIPQTGDYEAICWLQNARVLDHHRYLPKSLFPPALLVDIVQIYHGQFRTRIFNHSIAGSTPCRTLYMSAWAAEIDQLTWGHDILFVVAAGNLPFQGPIGVSRLPIDEHLKQGRRYPNYLLEDSCRIPSPAQSMQAITVGSISPNTFKDPDRWSLAQQDYPSAFSCTGFGLWEVIKPEVVEFGGDVVVDSDTTPNFTYPSQVCPELVRSTSEPGSLVAQDNIGTSFAAPKVTHIAACLAAELPQESCLLYRALIVQSARWPAWVDTNNLTQDHVIRMIGYGIPSLERALGGANNRITLITRGEQRIKARKAQIFQVKLPEALRSPGEEQDIRVEITLSYKAQPRRTRRSRRKYLSTWLDWECSKRGEDPESFLNRVLKEYDAPETAEEGESIFAWVLGKQKNHGKVHNTSRNAGTIQKDWAVVKSYDLRESFCIAVVGHEGWNNDPNADVPYALVISFEALNTNIPIYTEIASVQVPVEFEVEVTV
jgi:hypothetical protein